MKIFLVDRNVIEMDTYDSFVCFAESEDQARNMHPRNAWEEEYIYQDWCKKEECINLKVTLLGASDNEHESKVILASYNNS